MTSERVLVVDDSADSRAWLIASVAQPAGYAVAEAATLDEARDRLGQFHPDAIVLDMQLGVENGLELLRDADGMLPVIVTTTRRSLDDVQAALAAGARDVLIKPFEPERLAASLERALQGTQASRQGDALRALTERQRQEFNALYNIGKVVTSLLYVDEILAQVVSAAVNLTRSDEGSLFLLDPDSGELYLRANKNLDESTAHNLRVKVEDSLLGRVIQTGRPVMLAGDEEVKVKTSFLVKAIVCVPMILGDRAIGVLSVDYKGAQRAFSEHDVHVLSTLADYAAIAIENARLYWAAQGERAKLHTILRDTQDAVIVTDASLRISFVNDAARAAFSMDETALGRPLPDVVHNAALLDLFDQAKQRGRRWRAEVPVEDGRTLQGQLSEFSGIGYGAVLQDISRLKELDRVKSEFISIVSHDLRTPLTTIRGYVELLPRVGSLNEMQQDFVKRIERGTSNIVELIADLLDVSRIEAGLDWELESMDLAATTRLAVAALRPQAEDKQQTLNIRSPELPPILGNSRRLGQVVANLLGNAVKYTPVGGQIDVSLYEDNDFEVLCVRDNGIGISAEDQLRIFDKFFRVESDDTMAITGTGLGLAIVKTIVERHKGRVWVESEPGVGSVFSVLLPKYAM